MKRWEVIILDDLRNCKCLTDSIESEALEILHVASRRVGSENTSSGCSSATVNGAQTTWDMLHEEESCKHITTSCSDLDNILGGGGLPCGEVTEIGGVPGIGKTQLGFTGFN